MKTCKDFCAVYKPEHCIPMAKEGDVTPVCFKECVDPAANMPPWNIEIVDRPCPADAWLQWNKGKE